MGLVAESDAFYELYESGEPTGYLDQPSPTLSGRLEYHSGWPDGPRAQNGILGRDIAGASYHGYSNALLSMEVVWIVCRLREFLKEQAGFASGTSMPLTGLIDEEFIDQLLREWVTLRSD